MQKTAASIAKYLLISLVIIISIAPFWWLFVTSVRADGMYGSGWHTLWPEEFTSAYYLKLLDAQQQLPMLRFLFNTAVYCVCGVTLEVMLAALAAYPLARLDFKGKTAVMLVLAAALALPSQANTIVNFSTIRFLGLYDTMLGVILPGAVSVFGILLLRQAFLAVPRELEDAARLDGCGEFQIFRYVCLPLTRSAQAAVAMFAFTAHWNAFLWPLVILKSADKYPLSVGLAYLSSSFESDFRITAAGSVAATLPLILLFLVIQKEFIKGISSGALKG